MALLSSSSFTTIVKTPCIGVCSTGIGDNVCRGCKRFAAEVIHWNGLTRNERVVIYKRLEKLLLPIVESYLVVRDEALLREQMAAYQIDDDDYIGVGTRVLRVLQAGSTQIDDPALFGLAKLDKALDLPQIKGRIDEDFHKISVAHYDRYFVEPHKHHR